MREITPFLWFDNDAEMAARFYVEVFGGRSKIGAITRYGEYGGKPKDTVMTVSFELNGQKFVALNGGPQFTFNESISFVINCETQEEIDYFWEKLSGDGGNVIECGWLKDRFGVAWQVVPAVFWDWVDSPDSIAFERVMNSLVQMRKLDLATLQRAWEGA
jgi:predicted 3-demethylubiquinone-9 3-methyltransferase (glyoxalase superfamily)